MTVVVVVVVLVKYDAIEIKTKKKEA